MVFGFIVANKKKKNKNQDTIHFQIASYKVLQERKNKTVSILQHKKFQEKLTFTYALSVKSGKLK